MTTYLVYADESTSGDVHCDSSTYSAAREGTGSKTASTGLFPYAGQEDAGSFYRVHQTFMRFDTGVVPSTSTITSVGFDAYEYDTTVDRSYTMEVRIYNWGAAVGTGDFRAGSSLSSLTKIAGLFHGVGTISAGQHAYSVEPDAADSIVQGSGYTRVVFSSSRQRGGTAPSGNEALRLWGGGFSGTGSTVFTIVATELHSGDIDGPGGGTGTWVHTSVQTGIINGAGGGDGEIISGGLKILIEGVDYAAYAQDRSIQARQLMEGTSSLDFTLIAPPITVALGDSVQIEQNGVLWDGTVNSVRENDFLTKQMWVDVVATNETVWGSATAPWGLSDAPDGSTTYGYSELVVENRREDDGDVQIVTMVVQQPGLQAGYDVEVTNALHSWSAAVFTINEVAISWDTYKAPKYRLTLGTPPTKLGDTIRDVIEDDAPGYVLKPQQVNIYSASTSSDALTTHVSGESAGEKRLRVLGDGTLTWGDGSAAADTNFYRESANSLRTDGNFNIGEMFEIQQEDQSISTNQNPLTIHNSVQRLTVTANCELQSLNVSGSNPNKLVLLIVLGSSTLTVKHQYTTGSTGSHRIISHTGADFTMTGGNSIWLYHDTTSARWRTIKPA